MEKEVADAPKADEKAAPGIVLTEEQKAAVDKVVEFANAPFDPAGVIAMILTGAAGSGKSTVVREIVRKLGRKTEICATTGRAAVIVGGTTIDRLLCMDRSTWTCRNETKLERLMRDQFCDVTMFICDEASMIGTLMANYIDRTLRVYKKKILLVGDWAQAAPVKDTWPMGAQLLANAESIVLNEIHRQVAGEFTAALNEVRNGTPGRGADSVFTSCIRPCEEDDVVIMATNASVKTHNEKKLAEHVAATGEKLHTLVTRLVDGRSLSMREKYPLDERAIEEIISSTGAADRGMTIAVGCRVLITSNAMARDPGAGIDYVNGDGGTVVAVKYAQVKEGSADQSKAIEAIEVLVDRTGREVILSEMEYEVLDADKCPQYTVIGFPLRLGYAITIHKSQGATLNKAWVDTSSIRHFPRAGRHGLMYVALSRVRKVEDLGLATWDPHLVVNVFTSGGQL